MRLPAGDPRRARTARYELRGDESLSARPMERIAEPLRQMGAKIETTEGHAPLASRVGALARDRLRAAGRERPGEVGDAARRAQRRRARRRWSSRSPTATTPSGCSRRPGRRARARSVDAWGPSGGCARRGRRPGDFSSAAPLIVAATLFPGSELTIHDVGLNPRRTGLLDVLERMGARLGVFNRRKRRRRARRRPRGRARPSSSRPRWSATEVPGWSTSCRSFALAAACARGDERRPRRRGAARSRKRTGVETVDAALRALGVRVAGASRGLGDRGRPGPPPRRARSTRPATTGSRCSGRSQASPPARASRSGRRGGWR